MSAKASACEQVDRDRRVGVGVVDGVPDAPAAIQRVGTEATNQGVTARAAIDQVGVAVAREHIGIGRAGDVADVRERVTCRGTAVGEARCEIDRDLGRGVGIVERVDADAAVDAVRTGAALQRIVAIETVERVLATCAGNQVVAQATVDQVGKIVAGQPVGTIGPAKVSDALENVALRVAARARAGAQVHGHLEGRRRIVGRIEPAAANERVGAAGARQGVVTGATIQHVAIGVAAQGIVASGTGHRKDALQQVTRRIAASTGARPEVNGHGEARRGIVDEVGPATTRQCVGAKPADQRVVPIAAVEPVAIVVADQKIGSRRADEIAHVEQYVALCVTPDASA